MPEETQNAQEAQAQDTQETNPAAHAERMEVLNQTAIQEAELERQRQSEQLPDDDEPTVQMKDEFAKKEKEYQEELKRLKEERETFDKRLRDTQHKLHMVTADQKDKGEKPDNTEQKPERSFDDYVDTMINKFEESPSDAVKQMIQDFAADRQTQDMRYQQEIQKLKESLQQEMFMSVPDNAKYMAMVEDLNTERPDLSNLTLKQKLEYVKLRDNANTDNKKSTQDDNAVDFNRDLIKGNKRTSVKSGGLPSWLNDPDVQKMAAGAFSSKREVLDWLDPDKAQALSKKMAQERLKAEV